jgi:hypothetical protein
MLIALSSTDAVSLFSKRLSGSDAVIIASDGKFLVIEQRDIPLINEDVSHVFTEISERIFSPALFSLTLVTISESSFASGRTARF